MNPTTYWTKTEMDILTKHYPYMTVSALQTLLPGRSLRAIYKKANALELKAYARSEKYIAYLRKNLGRKTNKQMAAEVGCCEANIRYRIRTLSALI